MPKRTGNVGLIGIKTHKAIHENQGRCFFQGSTSHANPPLQRLCLLSIYRSQWALELSRAVSIPTKFSTFLLSTGNSCWISPPRCPKTPLSLYLQTTRRMASNTNLVREALSSAERSKYCKRPRLFVAAIIKSILPGL